MRNCFTSDRVGIVAETPIHNYLREIVTPVAVCDQQGGICLTFDTGRRKAVNRRNTTLAKGRRV